MPVLASGWRCCCWPPAGPAPDPRGSSALVHSTPWRSGFSGLWRGPNRQVNAGALAQLTAREREVAALAAYGMSNDEIAVALFISPATAKTHISRAMALLFQYAGQR